MPRKKAAAADPLRVLTVAPGPTPVSINCPACKSTISADGKTLHAKSGYLEELQETDAGVDEVENNIVALEKKVAARDATIADLSAQLAEKLKPAAPAPQKEAANVGQEQTRKSWWD